MKDRERHNHFTRDIKPEGSCPACDRYHVSQRVKSKEIVEELRKTDFERGLVDKYSVERVDGKQRGPYFVLDYGHDPHAIPALLAYADSCAEEYPELARDLRDRVYSSGYLDQRGQ